MVEIKDAAKMLVAAKKRDKESYLVIVDGNKHRAINVAIRTSKELITVQKCAKIVQTIQKNSRLKSIAYIST